MERGKTTRSVGRERGRTTRSAGRERGRTARSAGRERGKTIRILRVLGIHTYMIRKIHSFKNTFANIHTKKNI
jgi:hypothetical protein